MPLEEHAHAQPLERRCAFTRLRGDHVADPLPDRGEVDGDVGDPETETLRIPREIRTQALASFGVFQCIGAPIGLLLAGPALAHYDTHSVLAAVLGLMTVAAATFIAAALVERSSLRAALVDSAA